MEDLRRVANGLSRAMTERSDEALLEADKRSLEELITALQQPDETERGHAAAHLGAKCDRRGVEPLIEALQDHSWWVRWRVATALGKIGDRRAVNALIVALHDPEHEYVREEAAAALGIIGDVQAIRPLLQALREPNRKVREAIGNALGRFGESGTRLLVEALESPNNFVQERRSQPRGGRPNSDIFGGVIHALRVTQDPRAVKAVVNMLHHQDPKIRRLAAIVLGEIGSPEALPELDRAAAEDTGDTYDGGVGIAAQEAADNIRQVAIGAALLAQRWQHSWDVFISHASEDKDSFARPLASALEQKGLRVWFDEFTLNIGDSLRRSIDQGLSRSRYGVVILSPSFLKKEWPQKELDGLAAREIEGKKVLLPVWHQITADEIRAYSPLLADRFAVSTELGLVYVVNALLRAVEA